jgi:ABC-type Fe3+ transport system permease subunit/sugar lactone lactonase YvrE
VNWTLVQNSLLLGASATTAAAGLGWVAALFIATRGPAGRACALALAAVALVLPPFLVTNCWLSLLGHAGALRSWLPLEIYSLPGAAWILALLLWPITTFAVLGAWRRLEPALLDSESALVGWPLLRHALWPMAVPSLIPALVLTFVLALNNLAVPAILQVKVLPAEVWLQFSTHFNVGAALGAAAPLVLAAVGLLFWLRRSEVAWPRWSAGLPGGLLRQRLGGWCVAAAILSLTVFALSVAVPLAELALSRRTWIELPAAVAAGSGAIRASLTIAVAVACLTVAVGLAAWRWRFGRGLWAFFFLPGVLIGIALIFLFNRPWLAGIYQSLAVVILAFVWRYAALGWHGAAHVRRAVDADLVNAGRLFGASGWRLFRQVLWPQMAPQLLATAYVIYLLALWDVETLVLIVPPGGETLALRIFNLLHYGHNAQVNALCLALLALALAPLALWAIAARTRRWLSRFPARGPALIGLAVLVLATGCGRESAGGAFVDSRFFDRVEILGERGAGPGQFNKPRSLAVDRQDNLYVVDLTGRVQKFAPDGTFLLAWQMPETDLGRAKGMGLDAAGRVIVIEPHYSRVNHFLPDGRLALQWGTHETNGGQLAFPRAVAVNSRGELWISEYGRAERVQRFSPDGSRLVFRREAAGAGPGQFNRVEGLAMAPGDHVYLADSCNHRIQVLDAAGEPVRTFGRPGSGLGELSYPYDVRLDAAGRVFVCEFGNSRIQVFTPDGIPLEIIGGPGAAPGRFNNPWSIAFDSHDNLYVADALNHRVQKLLRRRDGPRQAGGVRPAPAPATRSDNPGGGA